MNWIVGAAIPSDWPSIQALLDRVDLPRDGLREHLDTTLLARKGDEIIACAALERYGEFALLRSLAVDQAFQGQGLGHDLIRAALDLANQSGVRAVYLLTDTAPEFFPRFGFKPIDLSEVPEAVQASVEFKGACPKSAVIMARSSK